MAFDSDALMSGSAHVPARLPDPARMADLVGATVLVANVDRQPIPGVITRLHSVDDAGVAMCNITAFPDSAAPLPKTSVFVYQSREAAQLYLDQMVGHHPVVAWLR